MLRNYKGISVDGFIAIYRMIYNLVFFKGEEKKSTLTNSPDAYYLHTLFPKDEERIKKEFGGEVPDVSFYNLKYLYKLDKNTIINFFLLKDEGEQFIYYKIRTYNIDQYFLHTERYIDVFIDDFIFSDNNPNTKDKTSNWMISKRCFVDLLKAIFYYFFPSYIEIEAIIALIVEVIIEGGHKQIDYNLGYLMDNQLYPGYLVADNGNFKLKNPYREKIDKIIKKYAEIDTIQQFLNPGIKGNDSNIDSFSDLLIDYLEEIRITKSNYEDSKPIPV